MEYKIERGATVPIRVHTVVISVQHDEHVTQEQLKADLMAKVIKPIIPAQYLDSQTVYHLQPSGRFIIGGPQVALFLSAGHLISSFIFFCLENVYTDVNFCLNYFYLCIL